MKKYIRKNTNKKYEGFSLVEMLITIVIIGVVMLISSSTLTSLIKISTVSSNKTKVRTETEFVLELVRRTIRNSNPSEVFVFDTMPEGTALRTYDYENNVVIDDPIADFDAIYANGLEETEVGNEIHFRPYGFANWVCIGFFPSSEDSEFGYILKTSAQDLINDHSSCFEDTDDYTKYTIVLNSETVDIDSFDISYMVGADGNYVFTFDLEAEPTDWYLGDGAPVNRSVFRQAVVTTGGLIW